MKRYQIVLVFGFAILTLAAVTFVHWMRPYNLETERADARAAGIPLDVAELRQTAPPPSENAAPIYAAMSALEKKRPLDKKAVEAAKAGQPSTAALNALITGRPDYARLVHQAAAKPHAYYRHRFSVDEEWPQNSQIRECAEWVRWESLLMARQGRYLEAVKNQALGYRFAAQAGEDPVIVSYLLSSACESMTLTGFAGILREAGPNAEVADAVRREIAAYKPNLDLTRSLKAEALFGGTFTRSMTRIGDPGAPRRTGFAKWIFGDPSEAVQLHWMNRYVQASQAPRARRSAELAKVQAEFDHADGKRPTYMMASIVIPVLSSAAESEDRVTAKRAGISTVAAVVAYRARTGRYPDTLREAINPEPADPYTCKPLGYRREGNGFVVWATPDTSRLDAAGARALRRWATYRYPVEAKLNEQGKNTTAG